MFKKRIGRQVVLYLLCFLATTFVVSPVAAAEWYEEYVQAERAIGKKEWARAIQLLQNAIEQEPEPARRKQAVGLRFIQYYPYLLLGRAFLGSGDVESARQACELSQEKGVAPALLVKRCLNIPTKAHDLSQSRLPPNQNAQLQQAPQSQHSQQSRPSSQSLPPLQQQTPQPTQPLQQAQTDSAPSPPPQSAQQAEVKMAVLNFQSILVPEELGMAVSEILRTELIKFSGYTVIEREKIEEILQEQEFQLTGTVDSDTAVELGKFVGAKFVVIGSVIKTGSIYTINCRMIDVETGIAKVGENIQGHGEDEIPNMVHQLAVMMIGKPIETE